MPAPIAEEVVITAGRKTDLGGGASLCRELWLYRELFYFLAWRDILVRYKQTFLGIAWSVIKVVVAMTVLSLVFGRLARMPSEGVPYPLLVFAALLPWQFFGSALTDAGNSLVASSSLISKVYFPRLIVPVSATAVSLVDFLIAAAVLAVLMAIYAFMPDWRLLAVPLFVVLAAVLAVGIGLWFAALTVEYRDFRYILGLLLQLGLYISPVGYTSAVVPEQWRLLYSVNPMVGVIDGMRWALLRGETPLYLPAVGISIGAALVLVAGGARYFRATERRFADVI